MRHANGPPGSPWGPPGPSRARATGPAGARRGCSSRTRSAAPGACDNYTILYYTMLYYYYYYTILYCTVLQHNLLYHNNNTLYYSVGGSIGMTLPKSFEVGPAWDTSMTSVNIISITDIKYYDYVCIYVNTYTCLYTYIYIYIHTWSLLVVLLLLLLYIA